VLVPISLKKWTYLGSKRGFRSDRSVNKPCGGSARPRSCVYLQKQKHRTNAGSDGQNWIRTKDTSLGDAAGGPARLRTEHHCDRILFTFFMLNIQRFKQAINDFKQGADYLANNFTD
jgi:hypothetical protein